jgi:hypothetical protein
MMVLLLNDLLNCFSVAQPSDVAVTKLGAHPSPSGNVTHLMKKCLVRHLSKRVDCELLERSLADLDLCVMFD